jgi:hypothetical protein
MRKDDLISQRWNSRCMIVVQKQVLTNTCSDSAPWPKLNHKYGPCTSLIIRSKIIGDTHQ